MAAAHIDSIRSIGPHFYSASSVDDWQYGITGELYLAAMDGGEVFFIATGSIDGEPAVLGFASHYHVAGGRHGASVYVRGVAARCGIGSALFRLAEADAMKSGATSIQLEASLPGVDFYKSIGFEEVSRVDVQLKCGRPIACVLMRKTLRQ